VTDILGDLVIRKAGPDTWELVSPIEARLDSGRIVTVDRGFVCDFGSIPSVFRGVVAPLGSVSDLAWLVHDRIYWGHRDSGETHWTRLGADDAMLELLLWLGTPAHIAYGSWTAVRAGALMSWLNPTERIDFAMREDHEFLDQ
jgi:hypothetical protein